MRELTDIRLDFLPDPPDGIYLVGGSLRDMLIGRPPMDVDLVVNGDLAHTAARIAERTGGRLIDLGKKGFAVFRIVAPSTIIDLTPLTEATIEADLASRDFTLNAMAYDLGARRLVDCTGGMADIRRRVIRMVAAAAFVKDPARLVRAYRMAAELGFAIDAKTQAAIAQHRLRITTVAGERVWTEMVKIFKVTPSGTTLRGMATSGLLTAIVPELEATVGCSQNHHHRFDVFEHSLRVYEALERLLPRIGEYVPDLADTADAIGLTDDAYLIKYGALLHDVGKPTTRQVDGQGMVRFPGHAGRSADMAAIVSRRLRLSTRQRQFSDAIIRHHIRPLFLFLAWQNRTLGPGGRTRFFNRCGAHTLPIVVHAMADILAKNETPADRDAAFIDFCRHLGKGFAAYRARQRSTAPLINGRDLMTELSLRPGPQFKRILNQVDEQRLSGTLTSREEALEWIRAHLIKPHAHPDA